MAGRPIGDLVAIHPGAGTRRACASAVRSFLDRIDGLQRRQGDWTHLTPVDQARHGERAAALRTFAIGMCEADSVQVFINKARTMPGPGAGRPRAGWL